MSHPFLPLLRPGGGVASGPADKAELFSTHFVDKQTWHVRCSTICQMGQKAPEDGGELCLVQALVLPSIM